MLDIEAAAAHLGISPDAVRKRLQRGTLAGRKIRGRWLIILPDGGTGQEDI
jgi:DNA-directed RNA polymerase specialized sigma24 family protein